MSVVTKTLHLLSGIVLGKDLITLTFVELREFDIPPLFVGGPGRSITADLHGQSLDDKGEWT